MKTALLAGSTGLVGSEVLKILENRPEYVKIHLLVRKNVVFESPKIVVHIIDFDQLDQFSPEGPIHDVYCCLGTTIKTAGTKEKFRKVDFDYVLALAQKARQWNAGFFVVSSLGANARSRIFYNRVKGEIEQAIQKIGLEKLFIFRPSLLMGNRKEHRAGEKAAINVYKIINPLFVGKLKRYKGIEAQQVAQAMVCTALENKEAFKIYESDEMQDL